MYETTRPHLPKFERRSDWAELPIGPVPEPSAEAIYFGVTEMLTGGMPEEVVRRVYRAMAAWAMCEGGVYPGTFGFCIRRDRRVPDPARSERLAFAEGWREIEVLGPAPGTVEALDVSWLDQGALTLRLPFGRLHGVFDGHAPLTRGEDYDVVGDVLTLRRPPAFTVRAVVSAAHG